MLKLDLEGKKSAEKDQELLPTEQVGVASGDLSGIVGFSSLAAWQSKNFKA